MAEIQITFQCVGGLFTPVLPVDPDGTPRQPDRIHYFSGAQVAEETGAPEAAVHEAYSVFLQEVGSGLQGADRAAVAKALLRKRFEELGDENFERFLIFCRQRDINPWGNHVWATEEDGELRVMLTADGFHALAINSGELVKLVGPEWCGPDGRWVEVWTDEQPPAAARVGVQRQGMGEPLFMIAHWRDYAQFQLEKGKKVYVGFWNKMPAFMLGKCAACLAIRRVYADRLDGIYSIEEMCQSKNPRLAPHEPPDVRPIPPEDLPVTSRQFHLRLIDYGFQDPGRRAALIDEFRRQFPLLYQRNVIAFYEKVLTVLRRTPETYGATVPEMASA